jgi:glycosyltransferase involved in cell wall biosynthesis
MCRFLQNFPSTDIRPCLWVHVSGCTYPYVRKKLLEKFDMVFFCCAKTYENGEVSALSPDFLKNNTAIIYGMGDVSPYFSVQREKHDAFTVGYLGTLSLSKIHPEFVAFCAAAELDNAVFLVAGDDPNKEVFYPDIMKYNMRHRIKFCGFLRGGEIAAFFSSCDVFGYPLNPLHFGATENVLLEAMASGLPAVVLNQGVEKFIVEDGKTGMVVSTKKEYGNAMRFLRDNPDVRIAMGKYARRSVSERFNTQKNRELLYEKYDELMEKKKHPVNFSDLWGNSPADMFLFAVENEKEMFEQNNMRCIPHIFREESKSSVFHFERYFPFDKRLRHWAKLLMMNINL